MLEEVVEGDGDCDGGRVYNCGANEFNFIELVRPPRTSSGGRPGVGIWTEGVGRSTTAPGRFPGHRFLPLAPPAETW